MLHSGNLLDVPQGSDDEGVPIIQWHQNGGQNQDWDIKTFSSIGDFDLVIIQSWDSGRVLDIAEPSIDSGAAVVQNAWSAAVGQLWIILPFGDTSLKLLVMSVVERSPT